METSLPLLLMAQEQARPNDFGSMIFMLVFIFAFFYLFVIRPQKREADEKKRLLEALTKNDRVVTSGGMYGTIVNIKEDEVTLRVDDQNKVKVRFAKSAIARVINPESAIDGDSKKS